MADVYCNECGTGLRWGDEYQVGDPDDDTDALCSECHFKD